MRLKAGLRSTVGKLHVFVVLRLNNVPAYHLSNLLHSVVQRGRGSCIMKLFSLSLHQQLVVFVLVIELSGSGGRGASLPTRPLLSDY